MVLTKILPDHAGLCVTSSAPMRQMVLAWSRGPEGRSTSSQQQ
jgi:hypothetical protein